MVNIPFHAYSLFSGLIKERRVRFGRTAIGRTDLRAKRPDTRENTRPLSYLLSRSRSHSKNLLARFLLPCRYHIVIVRNIELENNSLFNIALSNVESDFDLLITLKGLKISIFSFNSRGKLICMFSIFQQKGECLTLGGGRFELQRSYRSSNQSKVRQVHTCHPDSQ